MTLLHRPFFKLFIFTSLLLVILWLIALRFYLFWQLPWFNIPLHFIGGLWVGLITLALFFYYIDVPNISLRWPLLAFILSSVLIVGVIWEIFELKLGLSFATAENYIFDTLHDLSFDLLGGATAWFFAIRQYRS